MLLIVRALCQCWISNKCFFYSLSCRQQATCYPSFMDKLPSDATAVESRVQVEGQVVTSRGPGTAMEYSLALVEKLYGKDKADEVAGPMVNTIYLFYF